MNDISSTTGYILNGKLFPPSASYKLGEKRIGSRMIVLKDGDEIQVPGTPQGKSAKYCEVSALISSPALQTQFIPLSN